jgi:hypothetical protein
MASGGHLAQDGNARRFDARTPHTSLIPNFTGINP